MKNVEIEILCKKNNNLPGGLRLFADRVIFECARITKDLTNSCGYFPRLTGNLQESSMSQEIRKEADAVYCLDVPGGAEYAKYVWDYGENTNWTNPSTLPQWYYTTFINHNNSIRSQATVDALDYVDSIIGSVK